METYETSNICQRPEERGDLLEYSVIYTDRAINMLSHPFQKVMRDLSSGLKETYRADHLALVPGSGTFAMEAACRQFASGKKAMVLRNGYFSYRWTQIIESGNITEDCTVVKADFDSSDTPQIKPKDIGYVVQLIEKEKPSVVFAPQVETSTGVILSEEYIKELSDAVHQNGGLLCIDSIAGGTLFLDMKKLGVDILISAPQKGWSGPACCGLVFLSDRAYEVSLNSTPTSFSCSLTKWLEVMKAYENGGAMYHTTLPTDSLAKFRDSVQDSLKVGRELLIEKAVELGLRTRAVCEKYGLKSVAHKECEAPTVVVSYTDRKDIVAKFKANGVQVVGGVPFKIGEPEGLTCFRIGLFGLDKLQNIDRTVAIFEEKLAKVLAD